MFMEKMKKGISALLAFVMLVSVMLCNMVVSVSAATKVIPKAESLSYTLESMVNAYNSDVTLPTQSESGLSNYDSSDGYVSMSGEMTVNQEGNAHALFFKSASTINFSVEGDATISLGLCGSNSNKNGTISASATIGTITPDNCSNSSTTGCRAIQTFEYTGEQSDITINIPAGTYIHSLGITVASEPVELTATEAGKMYSYTFANNADSNNYVMNAGQEKLIDGVIKLKTTSGTISYNEGHGLQVNSAPLELSFIVPGNSTITLGRCAYSSLNTTISVSASAGTIDPESCDNKSGSDNEATEFKYTGGEATITFTIPNTSYIHSFAIENEAEPGTGTSFTYWFDDDALNGSVNAFNNKEVSGGTLSIPVDFATYGSEKVNDDNGQPHSFYRAAAADATGGRKGNGTTTALPTSGTALVFKPSNNGVATVYYTPTASNIEIYRGSEGSYTSGGKVLGEDYKYTFDVNNGTTYFIQTTATNNLAFAGIKFLVNEPVNVGVSTLGTINLGLNDVISFTDVDSSEVYDTYGADDTSVTLLKGHTYEISVNNAAIGVSFANGTNRVTIDGSELTINLVEIPDTTLSGTITFDDESDTNAINEIESIQFVNMSNESFVYDAVISSGAATYTVEKIKPGEYNTVAVMKDGSLYKTSDRVSVADTSSDTSIQNVNEVYFYQDRAVVPETRTSITVGTGEGADYKTLTEAVKAIKANDDANGRTEQVTISLNSDLEEQVNLDISNVKILGNGHELTWYYALGAQYYSVDSNGYYSEVLYRDAYSRNPVATSFWGGVLIVMGDNVVVEDLTIKNTFNYYVSDKEAKEGIIPDVANQEGSWTEVVAGSDVTNIIYKERANAVAPFGDKIEFYNCKILSSQDGLGINDDNEGCSVYYRDCVIGGNIDYICGGGTMLFDNCELEWYIMPGNTNGYGYITAPKKSPYIFRNCTITKSTDDYTTDDPTVRANSGYFGRCWGGADAKAYFINTETNGTINVNGWNEMSSTDPKLADFIEYCNTDNGSPATVTNNGNYASDGATKLTDAAVAAKMETYLNDEGIIAALNGWTPSHYVSSIVKDDSVNTVLDNNGNLIVYGFIDSNDIGKASNIGFMLSTLNSFIGKEQQIDDTVYEKVEYTDADGVSQTIADENGGYVFAYVVEGANTYDGTLNIRAIQISNDDTIYGPTATAELTNTSGTGAEEGGTETGTEVTEGTETEQPGTEGTGTDETVTDAGETVTNDADTGDSVTEGE